MKRRLACGAAAAALVVAMGVAPATAKGPPEIVVEEFDFADVNPCTGEDQTVFIRVTGSASTSTSSS